MVGLQISDRGTLVSFTVTVLINAKYVFWRLASDVFPLSDRFWSKKRCCSIKRCSNGFFCAHFYDRDVQLNDLLNIK